MNDGVASTRVLWRSDELDSAERFAARPVEHGWRFDGVVVLPVDGEPARITYGVELDAGWRTLRADVDVEAGRRARAFSITADGDGRWRVDGSPADALDGCIDIDLGFTPSTNTLQIRRLGLGVGESQTLPVAWLAFPELEVQPLTQTYARLGPQRWRYGSGDFTAELVVDADGYVVRYGEDLWRAVAHRTETTHPVQTG